MRYAAMPHEMWPSAWHTGRGQQCQPSPGSNSGIDAVRCRRGDGVPEGRGVSTGVAYGHDDWRKGDRSTVFSSALTRPAKWRHKLVERSRAWRSKAGRDQRTSAYQAACPSIGLLV